MDDDLFDMDLDDVGLGNLESFRERFERNADQAVEGDRAARGMGAEPGSQMDNFAREQRQKQTAVSMEINDRLFDIHNSRSETAQIADESKDAEIADSPVQWANDPNEYDWPGIDTKR